MKIFPKFQNSGKFPSKEYIKRKQQFLNQNGIKVKMDGRWGPWQEQQYKRLTTKNKHYNTTPLGFLSYLYDKTLGGGTTYQEDPNIVKGYSEEIKSDNRSNTRRYLDQQMQNNKTPLGYVTQTVLPSAAVAGSIVYGFPAVVNGIRTAVSNPSTILPATKIFTKEAIKGTIGATAVNTASKATTGKTWGEQVAQSTGVSSDLGEFTNPGFILGSPAYNISKNLYIKGPKYIFDNLPYKTIYNIDKVTSNIKDDAITFLRTPINKNPIKAVRNRHKSLQIGKTPRTNVHYDNNVYYNTYNNSIQDFDNPISQIRKRLYARMNNRDYTYSYPNDGIGIYLDNNMYNPDYIISQIPVKDYLSLKDTYKLGINKGDKLKDKVINAIKTPINYLKANTEPAFAYIGDNRFIKVNKKAIKDFGFDYPTVISHEYNHALRNNNFEKGKLQRNLGFNYSHLDPKYRDYLSSPTEIEARGTQLKNYFDSDIITPDMLKYASQHYVSDTNMDNNMYQFFSGIKDWDLAADYLSKFSLKNGGKL